MYRFLYGCAILLMLGLTSCATTSISKNFDQFVATQVDISDQTRARSGPLRGKQQKATVMGYDDTSTDISKALNVKGISVKVPPQLTVVTHTSAR